jgi:hypothetical protein
VLDERQGARILYFDMSASFTLTTSKRLHPLPRGLFPAYSRVVDGPASSLCKLRCFISRAFISRAAPQDHLVCRDSSLASPRPPQQPWPPGRHSLLGS